MVSISMHFFEANWKRKRPISLSSWSMAVSVRLCKRTQESTMSLIHKQMAWGGIVGITLLGCIAGCSLKEEPVPLPPVP
jgi:hypothetical protein